MAVFRFFELRKKYMNSSQVIAQTPQLGTVPTTILTNKLRKEFNKLLFCLSFGNFLSFVEGHPFCFNSR
ncbi:hypothetical protein M5D96_009779 [Drosophila gunungcola]|uniref:Uncharacterized protein n=1 Tax=Drosophila gunungcola TaxID=103775 RepID=A0A9P9YIK5_9MUSC|nr:hypothetical protein M5D96_009779 [Drosophila gunungcola]